FSSWKTDIAYVPGATPGNSQTACRLLITDELCATAFSVLLGKSPADEKREQTAWPLSLRNPAISTWIWFSCGTCAKAAEEINKKAPARANILRRVSLNLNWTSPFLMRRRRHRKLWAAGSLRFAAERWYT